MLIDQPPSIQSTKNDPYDLPVLAIDALDVLVSQLIRDGEVCVSSRFLDWVSDCLTATVLAQLQAVQLTSRFQETLRLGQPKVAMTYWVRHWACPEIKKHFSQYAKHCPCAKVNVVTSINKRDSQAAS
jgi:hypothetical protein